MRHRNLVQRRASFAFQSFKLGATARQPSQTALHCGARVRFGRTGGNQLIELHDHIGAEIALDLHHALGGVGVE